MMTEQSSKSDLRGATTKITPKPYLNFIVGTDHSVLAVWQQYKPIRAVWLRPNGPE